MVVPRLSLGSLLVSLLLLSSSFFAGINPNMAQSNSSSNTAASVAPGQTGIAVAGSLVQSKGSAVNPQIGIQALTNVTGPGGKSALKPDGSIKSNPATGSYSFHIMAEDHSGCTAINPKTTFLTSNYKAEVDFVATVSSSYEVVFADRSTNSRDWYVYYDSGVQSLSGSYCISSWILVSGNWPASNYPRAWLARVYLDGAAAFDEFFDVTDYDFSNGNVFETATSVDSNGNPVNPGKTTFVVGVDSSAYAYLRINDAAYCSESGWGECRDTSGHVHDMYEAWYHGGSFDHSSSLYWSDYKNQNINYNYWGWIYDSLNYISMDASKVGTWDVYFYLDYYYDGGSYYWYGPVGHIQFTVQGGTSSTRTVTVTSTSTSWTTSRTTTTSLFTSTSTSTSWTPTYSLASTTTITIPTTTSSTSLTTSTTTMPVVTVTTTSTSTVTVMSHTSVAVANLADFEKSQTGNVLLVIGDLALNPHGGKPPGVGYQQGRDTTPLGYIRGMLNNTQPDMFDTNAAINSTTGRPIGSWPIIFSIGGPDVNAVTHYYETTSNTADRAPIKWIVEASDFVWSDRNGNEVARVSQSSTGVPPGTSDVFVIQILRDADGRFVVLIDGSRYTGTWAAAEYFKFIIYPTMTSWTDSYYIVQWTDATSGTSANMLPDSGDTFTILAQGQ